MAETKEMNMKIVELEGVFFVVRGTYSSKRYFAFYVDHDTSCWSKFKHSGHRFITEDDAADCIVQLRKRDKIRREAKKVETSNV